MGILKNRDKKEIFIIQNEADILMFAEVWIRLGEVLEDFFWLLTILVSMIPPRQTYRLEWDSWQSCMVYHLHVARLHSTNIAYSPLHTLSPATTIHTVYILQYYHIPSAYPLRSKSGRDGQMGARTLEHRHIFWNVTPCLSLGFVVRW